MRKPKTLTAKQQAFVDQYVIDLNGTQAAIRAGYSAKAAGQIANDLLKVPKVEEAIAAVLKKKTDDAQITATWVLETIQEVVKDAKADKDRTNALRGLELLGKYLKLFEKQEQQGGVTVVITSALPVAPGQQVIDVTTEPIALPPAAE